MPKEQVNVRLDVDLLEKIDYLVRRGFFKTRTEAFKEAINMLIKKYYRKLLKERLEHIREGTEKYPSLTRIIIKMHEEEE